MPYILKFDGIDDYISLPAMNIDYSKGLTIEAWVYYNSFNSWSRIIDLGNGAWHDNIIFANSQTLKAPAFNLEKRSSGKGWYIKADEVLSTGKWMHLSVTVDASGKAKLYNNGQEIKSADFTLPDSVNRTLNYIGKSNWARDGYFHGQMAEIRLWNRALSVIEIQQNMNRSLAGNEPGLVAYWPLSEGSGNTVADKTGIGNNGTIYGASWTQDTSLSLNSTLTGQFEVLGNSDTGYAFVNNEKGKVSYTFTASGTWSPNINNPNVSGCTAEGLPSLHPYVVQYFNTNLAGYLQYLKYPKNTCFSLVAQNPATGTTTEVGKKVTIVLKPGETLNFVLNDWPTDYSNNSGSIKVDYSGINLVPKVMQFDGDKDYIALPEMNIDYSGGFTVEAWVWFDSFKKFSRIIEFSTGLVGDSTQNGIIFSCGQIADVESSDLVFGIYHTGPHIDRLAKAVLEKSKWTHVAATVDTSGNGILYKNGQQVASQMGLVPTNVKRTTNTIGGSVTFSNRDLKGKMADVRIWNKARTQAEIQADMSKRLTGQEPSLVGYWPLNETKLEGSALKVSDLSKNNLHGTITGALLVEDTTFSVY